MRVEQLSSGVKPRLLKLPGTPEVSGAETRSGGVEAETGEAFEDDTGQVIPVPDQVSEHADKERLLDQACEDVVVGAPRPEQCCLGYVYVDMCVRVEGHFAAEEP